MPNAFLALPFSSQDLQLLPVEKLSLRLQTSLAFVQLCLVTGCPTRSGRLSAAELLHWLFEHYSEVRQRAGFDPMPPIATLQEPARARYKMANAVITLIQFNASRSSRLSEKRHLYAIMQTIERAINRK